MKKLKILIVLLVTAMAMTGRGETVWQGSAILVVKPAKLKAFKKAVAKITKPTRNEANCITYYGYQVMDEKGKETNRFEFHEIWTSKEAMLIEHKEKSEHMKRFFNEIGANTEDSFLESFEVKGQTVQIIDEGKNTLVGWQRTDSSEQNMNAFSAKVITTKEILASP